MRDSQAPEVRDFGQVTFHIEGPLGMSARRTVNSGRDRARHQPVNWRRSRV